MFGHDKTEDKKDDSEDFIPVDTGPVNNGLLGLNDDEDVNDKVSPDPQKNDDQTTDDQTDDTTSEEDKPITAVKTGHDTSIPEPAAFTSPGHNELLDIKREALTELSPLVDQLDQTPEEKFKTTMMMIQATDDKQLIPSAYAATKEIKQDKTRAQALLDIINEINYFTQKQA